MLSQVFHLSCKLLRVLSWGWRWSGWWVEHGLNFVEDEDSVDEDEELTDKEKDEHGKKQLVKMQERTLAARECRIIALGAALRNREYDFSVVGQRVAFENGVKAVLNCEDLVGEMEEVGSGQVI